MFKLTFVLEVVMYRRRSYKRPDDEYAISSLKSARLAKWTQSVNPRSIKQIQSDGMRKVPITLAPIPPSKLLTKEELE